MKDVRVHGYLGIKLERVWEIVARDLTPLRTAVEAMRGEIPASEDDPCQPSDRN